MKTSKMPGAHRTFGIYSIFLCLLELSNCDEVTKRCEDACRNVAAGDKPTVKCNSACRQQQNNASQENSQDAEVPMCMLGCRTAVDMYAQNITAKLANLSSPVLKAGSHGNTSVALLWQERNVPNVTYRLQRLYTRRQEAEWGYQEDVRWVHGKGILVTNLHPFTSYIFRVVVVISDVHQLFSPPSLQIVTLPSGVPSGAPLITSISSLSSSIRIRWKPPFFCNAPLLPYKVTLNSVQGTSPQVMDVTSSKFQKQVTAIVTMLKPNTEYTVSIAARNRFGVGPETTKKIVTQSEEKSSGVQAYLILGANHSVQKQDIDNKSDKEKLYADQQSNIIGREIIYESPRQAFIIQDLAIHYYKRYIYFSDISGRVFRLTLDEKGEINETRVVYRSADHAGSLSVDWLHDKLYIAESNKIIQCTLEGIECYDVVDTLTVRPYNITADPYNGYLFWMHQGSDQGLNRIDMADFPVRLQNLSQFRIFKMPFSTYAIDYANLRIFFPNQSTSSMRSAFLDGSDIRAVHTPIQSSSLVAVTSLAVYNDRFYWTNGSAVFYEEYEPEKRKYHHNMFYIFNKPFSGLKIWHPSAQPIPVPLQRPLHLQAVFTSSSARLRWDPPGTDQGRGAWQGWHYEMETVKVDRNTSWTITCQTDQYRLRQLEAETAYRFRVRAFSSAGYGPWSENFFGETLKADGLEPHLVYATRSALYTVGPDGAGSRKVMTLNRRMGHILRVVAVNSWYLLVSEGRSIFVKTPDRPIIHITTIHDAVAVAYDWPAKKLFWSNARNQILRSLLNGKNPEVIHQGYEKASDLLVDSAAGFMYWSTMNTVEVAHLNGSGHKVIVRLARLDYHILGLALDLDHRLVYWLAKESHRTHVNSSKLMTSGRLSPFPVTKVALLEHPAPPVQHGLQYYSNRLFWLSSKRRIVVMHISVHNESHHAQPSIAQLRLPPSPDGEVRSFSLHSVAENTTTAAELEDPEPVDCSQMVISGSWNSFRLSWTPSPAQENAKVTYKIILTYGVNNKQEIKIETSNTYVAISNVSGLRPYSRVTVSISSCTLWACSERRQHNVTTPMAAPSVPQNPQGFVTYLRHPLKREYNIDVELHWSAPAHPNGRLVNYTIQVQENSEQVWTNAHVSNTVYFYRITNARKFSVYRFRVSTCTVVGCSPYSSIVTVNTSTENPVPKLLLVTTTSIISLLLADAQKSFRLASSHPVALSFEAEESALYWIDRSSHILKQATQGEQQFLDVSGVGKSIAVDWIGRALYWVEADETLGTCVIRTYNLDRGGSRSYVVVRMGYRGAYLAVYPNHSTLFWSEVDYSGHGRIMRSRMDGSRQEHVLGWSTARHRARRASPTCRCPSMPLTPVFQMDTSETGNGQIYFVDNTTGSIWVADNDGCNCTIVVNATGRTDLGLPPDSVAVDHQRVYWSREKDSILHSVLKKTGEGYFSRQVVPSSAKGGHMIQVLAYGMHLQLMPDPACLHPNNYTGKPILVESRNVSLRLNLTSWQPGQICSNISLPQVYYTVHYREAPTSGETCSDDPDRCKTKTSYDTEVTLDGLKPHQLYRVEVAADNHYMQKYKIPASLGPPKNFKTDAGVPSAPMNVSVAAVSPTSVVVSWAEPAEPNGELRDVMYELQWWQTNLALVTSPQVQLHHKKKTGARYSHRLLDLKPHVKYSFKVVAFFFADRGMGESSSKLVTEETFSNPPPLVLNDVGQDWLSVSWTAPSGGSIIKHKLQYSQVGTGGWLNQSRAEETQKGKTYRQRITNLSSNTEYDVRMAVWYNISVIYWPETPPKRFNTTAGIPGKPQAPKIATGSDYIAMVTWKVPKDGGLPIDIYRLAARRSDETNWTVVYNGSATKWEVVGLELEKTYVFRVAAHNSMGWGQPSEESSRHMYTPPLAVTATTDQLTITLAVIFTTVFIVILLFIGIILVNRLVRKHKPVPVDFVTPLSHPPDGDLVNLPQLPRTTRQQDNTLYAVNIVPTTEDVEALPHFRRDQLVLTKFLGSGAFGEVFEGVAMNVISEDSGETTVAVKTLRKGASNTEKEEFLKEALLMANFAHTHILRLLGVCLSKDPQFIILELMEGGDLLSYLRSCRPTQNRRSLLTLRDMVSICADVARGCKNLEDMHFVHRDLAARNCLVSSIDRTKRVVKIGDFGLARDIYKSDYYRKEGEGLLPVRWMSPESLIDGVFTTYSDVWAYGVLMWEVLTLGQQPYPARTNIEVLNYVCGGGRLDRPETCIDDLYNVMLSCWSFSPAGRPSFNYILSQLEAIQHRSPHTSSGSASSSAKDAPVIYSEMAGCVGAPPVTYTDINFTDKADGGVPNSSADEGPHPEAGSPYVQQVGGVKQSGPRLPERGRSRPGRRPSPSPYLEPINSQGGPHKYLELLGDDEPRSAAAAARSAAHLQPSPVGHSGGSASPGDRPSPGGRPSLGGRPHREFSPDTRNMQLAATGKGKQAQGVHYAQLDNGPDRSADSDNLSGTDSPEMPLRYARGRLLSPPNGSSKDYAQLADSDELDRVIDTDIDYTDAGCDSDRQRGARRGSCTGRPNGRNGWQHYAQIASTDSDTDSEVFERSRSRSGSYDPFLSHNRQSISARNPAPRTPGGHADVHREEESLCNGHVPRHSSTSSYTHDGYLAPTGHWSGRRSSSHRSTPSRKSSSTKNN